MNAQFSHNDPGSKSIVYSRRAQKSTDKKHKGVQEIQEANLFKIAEHLGFQEKSIVLF